MPAWTNEQQRVIDTRNHNILVSAAAGSGKTAVLVERIIQKITDQAHPVDVDRCLFRYGHQICGRLPGRQIPYGGRQGTDFRRPHVLH